MSRVVVGLDGSANSRAALRFAAEEARMRGATLHAIHAWRIPLILAVPEAEVAGVAPVTVRDLEGIADRMRGRAESLLDEAVDAEVGADGLEVRREVVEASPAQALVEASDGADLLVVGSRGRGGFTGMLLGSVSKHCAHHSRCPVVIVPDESESENEGEAAAGSA